MKITFLGTGTSQGIPVIGCSCGVCRSADKRNKRLRSSLLIEEGSSSIVIDTGTDFRLQALRSNMMRLDAVLLTHAHADHLNGLDDVRPFCRGSAIPVYGNMPALDELRERFSYIFRTGQRGGGKPKIRPIAVDTREFRIPGFDTSVLPVPVCHGTLQILGFRIGGWAYVTDCSRIPAESYPLLEALDVLVIDALRHRPHETHFSVQQALREIELIRPKRSFFTHLCHEVEHGELEETLPKHIRPAYDGLSFTI
jgi:phosphoribosyl 1,2-cyclic phosphate phosphodiesterase